MHWTMTAPFGLLGTLLCCTASSHAETDAIPLAEIVEIPIQAQRDLTFRLPELGKRKAMVLELDARVQRGGVDGYSPPAQIILNGSLIEGPRLVNKPHVAKLANGALVSWYHSGSKAWVLYYAESFDIINGEASEHRPLGVSASHFAFDVTDLAKEENVLTIRNLYDHDVQKIMAAECQIVAANIKLTFPTEITKPEEQDLRPFSYPMPASVTPRKNWKVDYQLAVAEDGGMIVSILGSSFPLTTLFSYPNGGYNAFGKMADAAEGRWRVAAMGSKPKYLVQGDGDFYRVSRRICMEDDRIDIADTITNKGDADLGVIVKHQVGLHGLKVDALFHGGMETFLRESSGACPENPTLYLAAGAGLGLVAVDDVFRVHHQTYALRGETAGLKDEVFAVPAKGEYTLEWSIYPTADPNYFTFINAVRRDWGLNSFLAPGCVGDLGWGLTTDHFPSLSAELAKRPMTKWPEQKYILIGLPCLYPEGRSYRPQYGYPMLQLAAETAEKYKALIAEAKKELGPEKKLLGYYGPTLFCEGDEAKSLFNESRVTLPNGEAVAGEGGSGSALYFPTETNAFGKMMNSICDQWLDWGADGVYFDYFDPSTCGTSYTYTTWDGHTAEVDPVTKAITRKFAAVDLLSCRYLATLVKRIEARGGVILANRGMTTRTSTEATKGIARLGEAGSLAQLLRAHLTPCPAGFQRTHLKEVHSQLLGALDYGVLTYPYDTFYAFPDNPMARIYPITVKELHQGYVIGETKIVAKRSGVYGWGDGSKITCFLYDSDGRPIDSHFPVVIQDGSASATVTLSPGQVVILERGR